MLWRLDWCDSGCRRCQPLCCPALPQFLKLPPGSGSFENCAKSTQPSGPVCLWQCLFPVSSDTYAAELTSFFTNSYWKSSSLLSAYLGFVQKWGFHNWTYLKPRRTYSRVVKNTLIKSTEKLRCTNLTHNSGHLALIQRTQMLYSTKSTSQRNCLPLHTKNKWATPQRQCWICCDRGNQWDQCDTMTRVTKMTISTFVTSVTTDRCYHVDRGE